MKPQTRAVLELLRRRPEGVTSLDALDSIGSFRIAARVGELRALGYRIETETLTTARGARIARYLLIETVAA